MWLIVNCTVKKIKIYSSMHGFSVEKGKQLSLMQLSLSSSQDENFSVFGGDFLFVFFYLESP